MSAVVSASWVVYGRLIMDITVQVSCYHSDFQLNLMNNKIEIYLFFAKFPNALGFILSLVQLSLFLKYPQRPNSVLPS